MPETDSTPRQARPTLTAVIDANPGASGDYTWRVLDGQEEIDGGGCDVASEDQTTFMVHAESFLRSQGWEPMPQDDWEFTAEGASVAVTPAGRAQ